MRNQPYTFDELTKTERRDAQDAFDDLTALLRNGATYVWWPDDLSDLHSGHMASAAQALDSALFVSHHTDRPGIVGRYVTAEDQAANAAERQQALDRLRTISILAKISSERHWQRASDRKKAESEAARQARARTTEEIRILRNSPIEPEISEENVHDLWNAHEALNMIYGREAWCDTLQQAAEGMAAFGDDADRRETLESIKRGLRLMPKYKLVFGRRCDATLPAVVPDGTIESVLVPAGWVGTSPMHRVVGIAPKKHPQPKRVLSQP